MKTWLLSHRVLLGVLAMVLVVVAGGGYVISAAGHDSENGPAVKAISGDLLYVDLTGGLDQVRTLRLGSPGAKPAATAQRCQRVYEAGGTTVCLRLAGPGPSYEAAVLDSSGAELRAVGLAGIPNRARVSASGKIVSWTSFVTGDSYSVPGGFSTRTGVLDLRTGTVTDTLEDFRTTVEGVENRAADRNFWGVTVAADDRTFYATMASANRTWLMRGDLVTRTMTDVRQTAECPSLSPDGTRVAYKKRVRRLGPWALAVLDLRTSAERVLPGTEGIDDQAAWLDDGTLAYGKVRQGAPSAVYAVPADGSAPPRVLVENAASPAPVR
ncbi:TolB family protein [Amycolatopsis sp. CA-230715]|uniref:TolB family protein n=1 Tax=Amycolatopsis sp. CA-230715 TaxID=2745196 RepID=UPI001C0325F5|nr:hypothetical protein [Amycolatopsis sp. CA-230715]QWF79808.1 hypothetical protein HUW46_03221 [Amycolatopsis sp. CA-230715]